jgi:transcription initiation factor TFIIA large subunit
MGPPQGNFNPPMQNNGPRIKSEPGLESPTGISQAPFQQPQPLLGPGASTAQQRAAQNLRDNYGQRAAASINAIQGNVPQPQGQQQQQQMHMQQQQQQQSRPQYSQEQIAHMQQQRAQGMPVQPRMTPDQLQQYRQAMAQNAANQAAQAQQRQQNGVQGAQTDGAGDDFVVMRGQEVMGRVEIDGLIRNKIAAMGQSMEGGGLMLPLHQATSTKSRQRKVKKSGNAGEGQMDGGDSDEDDKDGVKEEDFDEDAINSDLDDPDDGLNDEEDDDEGMGHIMLCMYDKVQRVKNKWYVPLPISCNPPLRLGLSLQETGSA